MNVEAEDATEQFLTILRKWKNFNDAVVEDYSNVRIEQAIAWF